MKINNYKTATTWEISIWCK